MPTTEVPQETAIQRESVSPQTEVPTTPPPKAKKDPKKKKIRRFGASSNNRNGLPGTKKEDLSVGINEKVEEPLLYSSPPVERVAYNKDGTLDLTANRIDFKINGKAGSKVTLYAGEYVKFTIDRMWQNGDYIQTSGTNAYGDKINFKPSKELTYKSSNNAVATVTNKGVITAKKKGTCKITVTSIYNAKVKGTIKVTVSK